MRIDKNTIQDICLTIIKNEWLSTDDSFPDFLPEISYETKMQNEAYVNNILTEFQAHFQKFPRLPIGRKRWNQKTLRLIITILNKETVLGIHRAMDEPTIDQFYTEVKDFLQHARRFAPKLTFEEIGQALRNYIVYAMFKEIHQVKTGFSKPGFGYSMLYPFTDNYIDSINLTDNEKAEYNQLIRHKLEGKPVHPHNEHHRKTCDLLQAIEDEYPREKDTTVYTLLLTMLEAQEESLRQQKKNILLSGEQRLDISLYKGGISVLIDRFLVNKEVTDKDLIFYLGFGFFLQLADDLQDIKEDSSNGYQTVFTVDLHAKQEEKLVNKMLHFIYHLMASYQSENDIFKDFVLMNCYQLIFTSILGSKEFFSKDYLKQIEKYLPVSLPYLETMLHNRVEKQDNKKQSKYMKMLDSILSQ
ncbi:hypothetical protein I5677_14885 [Mobilitalea sibirica]|uniref:Uncharacterized protein n=1 Tax=Mobilitalea sibirica TaxID=1462919 RepID=A0A8J7L0E5_9FIRM|nr:hypothetical protein [Mobilitalea sibirica]MBH1942183.1 hypothetical protein [Mobilitalea sibirica]